MKSTNRWVMLLVAFLGSFTFYFSMQSVPPLLPSLISEFHLSHASASTLMVWVALPRMIISILGGVLVGKYGIKAIGTSGLLLVAAGALLSSLAPSFQVL